MDFSSRIDPLALLDRVDLWGGKDGRMIDTRDAKSPKNRPRPGRLSDHLTIRGGG